MPIHVERNKDAAGAVLVQPNWSRSNILVTNISQQTRKSMKLSIVDHAISGRCRKQNQYTLRWNGPVEGCYLILGNCGGTRHQWFADIPVPMCCNSAPKVVINIVRHVIARVEVPQGGVPGKRKLSSLSSSNVRKALVSCLIFHLGSLSATCRCGQGAGTRQTSIHFPIFLSLSPSKAKRLHCSLASWLIKFLAQLTPEKPTTQLAPQSRR